MGLSDLKFVDARIKALDCALACQVAYYTWNEHQAEHHAKFAEDALRECAAILGFDLVPIAAANSEAA